MPSLANASLAAAVLRPPEVQVSPRSWPVVILHSLSRALLAFVFSLVACHTAVAAGKPSGKTAKATAKKPGTSALAAEISLLDAVRVTLSQSTRIKLEQKRSEVSRGTMLARAGVFDTRFVGNGTHGTQRQEVLRDPGAAVAEPAPAQPTILPVFDLTTGAPVQNFGIIVPPQTAPTQPTAPGVFEQTRSDFDLALRKRLRNGAEVAAQGIYSRQNQQSDGPVFNISELRMTLRVPVLRAFTLSEEASLERAAKIDYAASLLVERHVVSEAIFETARAYWQLRAARERLELLRQSEETAVSFRTLTQLLIEGDERPRSEIFQVDARVSETTVQRVGAEQQVFEARQRLGLAMGLTETQLLRAPNAGEPFPGAHGLARAQARRDGLIAAAMRLRADYQASLKNEASALVLLDSARRNLLPRFDFQVQASAFGGEIGGEGENISGSFFGNQTGVGVFGQLSFDWPFANREKRGLLIRSGAEADQAWIRTVDLRRNIVSGVVVSIHALVNGAGQLQQADSAVGYYASALDAERQRFEAGQSTLLDLINTEERLTNAFLSAVSAKQQIAEAYARLRFESGTMLAGDGPDLTLSSEVLVTVPSGAGEVPLSLIPDFKTQPKLR
jgi:outer membrane protein TolC